MTLIEVPCPICGTTTKTLPRYPRRVCGTCAAKASDESGRALQFFNTSLGVVSSPTTRTRTRPRPTPVTSASSTASAATPTRHVSAESSLSRSPTSPSSDSRSPFTPHPRPCTRPPISRACLAFRWPYPLCAGLAVYVLGLFTFACAVRPANVNKPSKPRIGPAKWHRRPRSCAPHPRPQRRAA